VGKRLFLAVDIDARTREAISHISSELRSRSEELGRMTWVHPDRMHLTLHFMGDADETLERRALDALGEPIRIAPFALSFKGLGFFPRSGSPRVLWLGISEGLHGLRRVHELIEQRLSAADPASDAYNPHLTLARFRHRVARSRVGEIAAVEASAGPCVIDRVTLYQSRLSPAGPTYAPLGETPLKP
jgi:2'-5' RNA ligase